MRELDNLKISIPALGDEPDVTQISNAIEKVADNFKGAVMSCLYTIDGSVLKLTTKSGLLKAIGEQDAFTIIATADIVDGAIANISVDGLAEIPIHSFKRIYTGQSAVFINTSAGFVQQNPGVTESQKAAKTDIDSGTANKWVDAHGLHTRIAEVVTDSTTKANAALASAKAYAEPKITKKSAFNKDFASTAEATAGTATSKAMSPKLTHDAIAHQTAPLVSGVAANKAKAATNAGHISSNTSSIASVSSTANSAHTLAVAALPKSGGTVTGTVNMGAHLQIDGHAIRVIS